jgi:branched-chain amino acid transport system ATP-binding protein
LLRAAHAPGCSGSHCAKGGGEASQPLQASRTQSAGGAPEPAAPILEVRNLEVVYDDVALVLRGVSLAVPEGEIVALLGANGAGKTTLLRAITGLLRVHRGEITKGAIELVGERIDGRDASHIVRHGIAQVMEGRRIFAELTVEENLRAGAFTRRSKQEVRDSRERVMNLFPRLEERRDATAGYLSGGEQQMLAIGRALMANPRVLLLDEPSLGLAPRLVEAIRDIIVQLNEQGTSVLLVEQNAAMALSIASSGYVMETGKVVKDGTAQELTADRDIQEFYLGVGEAGRRSFRDVKSYRRKKRWSG